MNHDQWLESLKPGDEVCVIGGWLPEWAKIKKVERLTKTQIVLCAYTTKFKRGSGYSIGGYSHGAPELHMPNSDRAKRVLMEADKRRMVSAINGADYKNVSFETVTAMYNALNGGGDE